MSRIISIHSFCRGTGKSNLAANIGVWLAMEGRRVGVVDTDLPSPGLHILFGLHENEISYRLNDYLAGRCGIEQSAYNMTLRLGKKIKGQVFLFPSSTEIADITRWLCEGCEMDRLNDGFHRLSEVLKLDALVVDTHAGLSEETLISFALTDVLGVVLDLGREYGSRGCQGTAVTIDVARRLEFSPRPLLIVNKTPQFYDPDEIKKQVEEVYQCEVAGVLPHSSEMMVLGSAGIFALRYPNHPMTAMLGQIADKLMT